MTVELPRDPKDGNYEDLISSCLLGLGYFIETNLRLREETTEVLELDVVATSSANPLVESFLVDAKSGNSAGFADLFKMYGWMTYLSMERGLLVRAKTLDPLRIDAMTKISDRTGVQFLAFHPGRDELSSLPEPATEIDDALRTRLIRSAWWGRIAQRSCQSAFNSFVKGMRDSDAANAARNYRSAVDNSFFAKTPIGRASRLYAAYSEAPKITQQIALEMAGGDGTQATSMLDAARGTRLHEQLQYTMILESSARLGILKNALLHVLHREAEGKLEDVREAMSRGLVVSLAPQSFQDGLNWLTTHEHRQRIPLLMQLFIEVFGGFYRADDERELDLLARASGIPTDSVPDCLCAFDELFPIPNGWFFQKNGLVQMKAIPGVFRGTGAFLRRDAFAEQDYEKLFPNMGWLVGRWHNVLYAILKPLLGSDGPAEVS